MDYFLYVWNENGKEENVFVIFPGAEYIWYIFH